MRRSTDPRTLLLLLALVPVALAATCGAPPVVLTSTPAAGSTQVSVHAALTAAFDQDIDPGSIQANSITLTRDGGGAVSGDVSIRNRVLGFKPDAPLDAAASYTARVDSSVMDENGDPMGSDFLWSFTTGAFEAAVTPSPILQDVDTGLTGVADLMLVVRNQRHVEAASDGTLAMAIQRGQGSPVGPDGVALYRSTDEGLNWSLVDTVATAPATFADMIVRDDDGLLFAYTEGTDVSVSGFEYNDLAQTWTAQGTALVESFTQVLGPERATIVEEPGGLWVAFMTPYPDRQLLLYHSADGSTWAPNGQIFGTANTDKKSSKLLVVGNEVWLFYYDLLSDDDRRFFMAVRQVGDPIGTPWAIEEVARINRPRSNDLLDPLNSHWSIARAPNGDVHLAYQDDGVRHLRYDGATSTWAAEADILTAGVEAIYPTVGIGEDGTVVVTFDFDVERKLSGTYSQDDGRSWSFPTFDVHQQTYQGNLRAVMPERFDGRLPIFLQTKIGNSDYLVRGALIEF